MSNFLFPKEIAESCTEVCKKKTEANLLQIILLGILAGVYIGFGAELSTMVTHDLSKFLGIGFAMFIGGSVFSVGLMLVVIAGAELFTGNCLIMTGVLKGDVTTEDMLRNWFWVYIANFIGSVLLVTIMYYSGLWKINNFGVGAGALKIAFDKVNLSFWEAFFRGIGCNWLVCLAVWMAMGGKDLVSKIFAIYFPIMAFVASGFEHSIANMYFIPIGLFLKSNIEVVNASGLMDVISNLTWYRFFVNNLIPVTLGNIVGGGIFVGGIYYLSYLYKRSQ